MKRLFAFQLMLTEKKGVPLSRLLTLKEADARYSKRGELSRVQEESAFPMLSRRSTNVVKVKEEQKEIEVNSLDKKKEEEEEGGGFSKGASTGGSTIFTPRSLQAEVTSPTLNPFPLPALSPIHRPTTYRFPSQLFTHLHHMASRLDISG